MPSHENLDSNAFFGELNVAPLLANYGFLTRTLAASIRGEFKGHFGDLPVVQGEALLLSVIALNEGLSQNALAQAMSVKKAALAISLRHLVTAGLIERSPVAADRRFNSISLTPRGNEVAAVVRERLIKHNEEILAPLTHSDRSELLHLLNKLLAERRRRAGPT